MLTSVQPFTGDTPFAAMHKHLFDPPPSILTLRPDLPPEVQGVMNKALAKDRDQRFHTAGDLAAAFQACLQPTASAVRAPAAPAGGTSIAAREPSRPISTHIQSKFPRLFSLYEQANRQTIQEVGAIHEGASGATVLLVHLGQLDGGERGGMAYAKIARLVREPGEDLSPLERERANHLSARGLPCAESFVGEIRALVGPDERGLGMLVYRPAHASLSVRSLGEVVDKIASNEYRIGEVAGQVRTLLKELRGCWHTPEELSRARFESTEYGQTLSVPELLESLIQIGPYSTPEGPLQRAGRPDGNP